MSYELRKSEDKHEDILSCESCSCEVPTTEYHVKNPGKPERISLRCSLCFETTIGNAHDFPQQYPYVTPRMLAEAIHWLRRNP